MTEKELRQSLVRAAKTFGWRTYFTWSSMHSPKGFPDLVLLKPPRLVIAELKTEAGKVSLEQAEWLEDWQRFAAACGHETPSSISLPFLPRVEVYVWRPADLEDAYRVLMS